MAPTDITAGTIPMSFVLNLLNGTPLDPAGQGTRWRGRVSLRSSLARKRPG